MYGTINFATNLDRIGVTDIGRRSMKLFTDETFRIGVTNALFHTKGGLTVYNILSVLFTKLATTHANSTEQCFKTNPGAVFLTEFNNLYILFRDRVINESVFMDRFNDSI